MKQYQREFIGIATAFLFTILFLSGCEGPKLKTTTVKVIDGFSSPESVIADPSKGYIFVSNMGVKLEPSKKDKDGFISRLSADGKILEKKYFPKTGVLHAPKGMAIIGKTLFVTDIDRVVGFDITTRKQNFTLDFSKEKTVFLNDLTVFNDHTLFVSATDIGKIYKISINKKPSFKLLMDNITGANGLYFDSKQQKLFVVSFGEGSKANGALGAISFQDNKPTYQKLTEQLGALDGVALLPDSKILFSDWVAFDKPGVMRVYNLNTKKLTIMNLPEEVHGPADFFYDGKNNQLWLPKMLEGKVLLVKIG